MALSFVTPAKLFNFYELSFLFINVSEKLVHNYHPQQKHQHLAIAITCSQSQGKSYLRHDISAHPDQRPLTRGPSLEGFLAVLGSYLALVNISVISSLSSSCSSFSHPTTNSCILSILSTDITLMSESLAHSTHHMGCV